MPFPNEHSARLKNPDKYKEFRRQNNKFGSGIHAVFGILIKNGKRTAELQAIRFSKNKFTIAEVRKWLKGHDYKPLSIEKASEDSVSDEFNRFDYNSINSKHFDESTGFLTIDGFPTRTGIFVYQDGDGSFRRELRLPEEVFDEKSVKTLEKKPITNDHPPKRQFVTVDNVKDLMVGINGDVSVSDPHLRTSITIHDKDTIQNISDGKSQLSCGYKCNLEHTSGEWNGQRYDAIQRNIRYNHIAVVNKGRAGDSACLKLDSMDAEMTDRGPARFDSDYPVEDFKENEDEESFEDIKQNIRTLLPDMSYIESTFDNEFIYYVEQKNSNAGKYFKQKYILDENKKVVFVGEPIEVLKIVTFKTKEDSVKLKIDNKELEVTQDVYEEYNKLKSNFDSVSSEKDKIEAHRDSLIKEVEKHKTEKLDDEKINEKVKIRIDLYKIAEKILDEEDLKKLDSMSELEIKKLLINKNGNNSLDLDKKSDSYIEAAFDIIKTGMESQDHTASLGKSILNSSTKKYDSDKAREDMLNRDRNAWKKQNSENKA